MNILDSSKMEHKPLQISLYFSHDYVDSDLILKDKNVKAILVNIFGGIVRCDRVAQGIVDAYKNIGSIPVPIIVRLQGTNAEEAKKIIDESGLKVFSAIQLKEAADLVNEVLKK